MRDIAHHLGVSRQLVSLVMRGAPGPSAESRDRILAAARDLGYRPNASARLLRQRRTHLIGAMFVLRNPFEVRFVERFVERAAEEGFGVVLGAHSDERPTDVVVSDLMAQRVEALVAFNPDPASPALQDALDRLPVVWLGEKSPEARADNVRVDEVTGLRLAVEHLVELGHQDIAYVGGDAGIVGRDRAEAYRSAMVRAGLGDRVEVVPGDFGEEDGAAAAREIASRPERDRPTAVLSCGDLSAVGLLAAFARADVSVPDDISVVGFDDSYVCALSYNDLTSVRQDVEATVEAALETVLARLAQPSSTPLDVLTPTVLVTRGSTGRAPATAANAPS
ncbi:LacI family transcriptional regulator [Frigoribacterium sp. ACAM 257]|nr:LacI family transcriptional regulator [Frigoribacterium sp. ACAM 257]